MSEEHPLRKSTPDNDILLVEPTLHFSLSQPPQSQPDFPSLPNHSTAEDTLSPKRKRLAKRTVNSTHTLFFENPNWKPLKTHSHNCCSHFLLNWRSALCLILQLFVIIFNCIFGLILKLCEGIILLCRSVLELLLSILLIVFFVLTSCFHCPYRNFTHQNHIENLSTIRWKNTHNLYLFIKIEALLPTKATLGNHFSFSKNAAMAELSKSVPTKSLRAIIRVVR